MFRHWDKWIKHRFQKVITDVWTSVSREEPAAELNPPFCSGPAGEVTVPEGNSIFSQIQSLAVAVQQSGAPRRQPREV